MATRAEQWRATHDRIVAAAVELLIEEGYAATTAFGVQKRAGVTRGALLHHFPSRDDLATAAVQRMVEVNLDAVREELAATQGDADDGDPIIRAVRVLYRASRRRSFGTELELWAASRADERLRTALLAAERIARKQLDEMIDELFGPDVVALPGYRAVVDLTVQFIRGLTISGTVQENTPRDTSVENWATVVRALLRGDPLTAMSLQPHGMVSDVRDS